MVSVNLRFFSTEASRTPGEREGGVGFFIIFLRGEERERERERERVGGELGRGGGGGGGRRESRGERKENKRAIGEAKSHRPSIRRRERSGGSKSSREESLLASPLSGRSEREQEGEAAKGEREREREREKPSLSSIGGG